MANKSLENVVKLNIYMGTTLTYFSNGKITCRMMLESDTAALCFRI